MTDPRGFGDGGWSPRTTTIDTGIDAEAAFIASGHFSKAHVGAMLDYDHATCTAISGEIVTGKLVVPAGCVLGRVTASKLVVPAKIDAADGSQNAIGFLTQAVDATDGNVAVSWYEHGRVYEERCWYVSAAGALTAGIHADLKTDLGTAFRYV